MGNYKHSKKRKKIKKGSKKIKIKIYRLFGLFFTIFVVSVLGLYIFSKKTRPSIDKRYSIQNRYLSTIENYNTHLQMRNNKIENTIYESLDTHINNKLKEYIQLNGINPQSFSLTIVNKSNGDRIKYNSEQVSHYEGINKYFLLIVYNELIEEGLIEGNQLFKVKEYDISESSVLITKNSIGQEIKISELLRMAYKQDDQSAKNILNRILTEEINSSLENEIRKFINYNDQEYSSQQIIEIANKISQNPNIYWEVLNKGEANFIKYIDYSNAMTISKESSQNYYEIGTIISNIEYTYALHSNNIDYQNISEIGDLIDREMKNYYIQRKY